MARTSYNLGLDATRTWQPIAKVSVLLTFSDKNERRKRWMTRRKTQAP